MNVIKTFFVTLGLCTLAALPLRAEPPIPPDHILNPMEDLCIPQMKDLDKFLDPEVYDKVQWLSLSDWDLVLTAWNNIRSRYPSLGLQESFGFYNKDFQFLKIVYYSSFLEDSKFLTWIVIDRADGQCYTYSIRLVGWFARMMDDEIKKLREGELAIDLFDVTEQ